MIKEYIFPTILETGTGYCSPHFHDAIEIMFVMKGQGRVCCDGIYYEQPTGSIIFVPPQSIHSYDQRTDDFYAIVIIIETNQLSDIISYPRDAHPVNPVWVNPEMDNPIWNMVRSIFHLRQTFHKKSTLLLACGILNEVLGLYDFSKQPQHGSSLQRMLHYCQQHFRESVSISTLSAALSLSEGHISHLFTYSLHQSFPDYINALRTSEAIRLMRTTDQSISEICSYCGFNSIRTFNRAFLKQHNMTPSQYRKNIHNLPNTPIA